MAHQDSTIDLDKLLEIAESSEEPVKFEDTEAEKYIAAEGIESGDKRIPTFTIYYHYHCWNKNKKKLLTRRKFFLQFKKHFQSIQTSDGKAYLLNPEPFDLTREGYFKARALLRRERSVRKKEKATK